MKIKALRRSQTSFIKIPGHLKTKISTFTTQKRRNRSSLRLRRPTCTKVSWIMVTYIGFSLSVSTKIKKKLLKWIIRILCFDAKKSEYNRLFFGRKWNLFLKQNNPILIDYNCKFLRPFFQNNCNQFQLPNSDYNGTFSGKMLLPDFFSKKF